MIVYIVCFGAVVVHIASGSDTMVVFTLPVSRAEMGLLPEYGEKYMLIPGKVLGPGGTSTRSRSVEQRKEDDHCIGKEGGG